jgi:hypothetical protein
MSSFLLSKLTTTGSLERALRERLSEPLHLNFISVLVAVFGSYRSKVYFDLAFRQYTAFNLLDAAKRAASLNIDRISAVEFGVASGAGLLNICEHASKTTAATGVKIDVYGFDTGKGLPPPRTYRDHPELYRQGDFPMAFRALESRLPPFAKLVIGDIAATIPDFLTNRGLAPLGYIAMDVDYYWSAVEALRILDGPPELYLPIVNLYLDDCQGDYHNPSCGDMLACAEFNDSHELRKIHPFTGLREKRLFKNASWISKVCAIHVLDHPQRTGHGSRGTTKVISNPYLETAESSRGRPTTS